MSRAQRPRLTVIVPVFNEHSTVGELIRRVDAIEIDKQVVVVDDGSTDGTASVLAELANSIDSVDLISHSVNQGKGAAIRRALGRARGELVVIQDADLEYDPISYHQLVAPIDAGHATVVYGSRFLGRADSMGRWHRFGNKMLTRVFNMLYGTRLTDLETCYKLFPRDAVDPAELGSQRWGIDPEITARLLAAGHDIVEVPIRYEGRRNADGKKIRWNDGWSVLSTMIRLRLGRPLRPRSRRAARLGR